MSSKTQWDRVVDQIAPEIAAWSEQHDREGTFVAESYARLRSVGAMSVGIPEELGGAGLGHGEVCELIRRLAHHCPSTALSFSMHTHVVAAMVWRFRQGNGGDAVLRRIAAEQLVLLSTGGSDWVHSNGKMERVDGGYRVTARKIFGSGAPAADLIVTSARFGDAEPVPLVLHFAVPARAPGVRILDDWNSFGMRGTGSNTVMLEDVFVPESSITLARPAGRWHPVWSMIVTLALPIFLAPYLGLAERARMIAVEAMRDRSFDDDLAAEALGEVDVALTGARLAWREMVRNAADGDFDNTLERANHTLHARTLLARGCIDTVQRAIAAVGGRAYDRRLGLERCLRDVMAIAHHPLPERKQQRFSGRVALGLDPVG
jgi:alkylation response protein AidB-like acyl-CoA dehydrogenase